MCPVCYAAPGSDDSLKCRNPQHPDCQQEKGWTRLRDKTVRDAALRRAISDHTGEK